MGLNEILTSIIEMGLGIGQIIGFERICFSAFQQSNLRKAQLDLNVIPPIS